MSRSKAVAAKTAAQATRNAVKSKRSVPPTSVDTEGEDAPVTGDGHS